MIIFNNNRVAIRLQIFFVVLLIGLVVLVPCNHPCYAQSRRLPSDEKELSIALLNPYIEKVITDFYGYNRRYEIGDSQIEILERHGNIFTVKVVVDTFEGAHNDYYTEKLVLVVTPSSVILEEYTHSDFIT